MAASSLTWFCQLIRSTDAASNSPSSFGERLTQSAGGNGAPVNLGDWGLGGAFENSQSVENAVSTFEASIVAQGSSLAAALCAGKRGRQIAVFTSDGQTVTNVRSVPCLFSVGHSTFFERATSTLDADCCGHKFTIRSFEHYFIRDKFTDPLDGETVGMPFDLGAGPAFHNKPSFGVPQPCRVLCDRLGSSRRTICGVRPSCSRFRAVHRDSISTIPSRPLA